MDLVRDSGKKFWVVVDLRIMGRRLRGYKSQIKSLSKGSSFSPPLSILGTRIEIPKNEFIKYDIIQTHKETPGLKNFVF